MRYPLRHRATPGRSVGGASLHSNILFGNMGFGLEITYKPDIIVRQESLRHCWELKIGDPVFLTGNLTMYVTAPALEM